jgi:dTDP-4-dehydrorhamnose reductase
MILLSNADSALARVFLPVLRDRFQVCAFGDAEGSPADARFMAGLFDEIKPDAFVCFPRLDDIEACEYAREDAYRQNAFMPGDAARLCAARGVRFVYISSAYVFDGTRTGAYAENDPVEPATAFGDSVLLGERLVRESGCAHLVLRLPDIYGAGGSWLDLALGAVAEGRDATVIRNRRISPLSAARAAQVLAGAVSDGLEGIFHAASAGSVSAADFLKGFHRILRLVRGTDGLPAIVELPAEEYLSPVEWPLNTALDPGALASRTGLAAAGWEAILEEFVRGRFSI